MPFQCPHLFPRTTEKREKMAVMEAAISSSLAHPNVVATYTYSIKPVRDTTTPQDNLDTTGMVLMGRSTIANGVSPPEGPCKVPSIGDTAIGNVHSFEVRDDAGDRGQGKGQCAQLRGEG